MKDEELRTKNQEPRTISNYLGTQNNHPIFNYYQV